MGWQELTALAIVALAAFYVIRHFIRKYINPEAECGGCGKCAAAKKSKSVHLDI